ncbi:EF-hand domain-containing protein [Rehaibacterium terrae]|jgi:hypothetical protein|uniref:EF-hand domain-containing protein n=1 Tax=Rehaibacterium terrae TaxID=1341696 RepID=A0A7W7XXF3_9GAMM|nr:EF-hand domain-containing protein [Rehaibacterium terrae]MBB5014678.1 hypothetical protein [Rehaibacterium terrae]
MTIRHSRLLLACAVGALFAAGAVHAQGERSAKPHPGLPIGVAELEERLAARSAEIDADGDGYISFEELRAWREAQREQRMRERFARLDTDGDGRVSVAEFEARHRERVARMDADGDGIVTREEFRAYRGKHGRMHRRDR